MGEKPEIVPDKLDNPINYKIIALIVACVISTHIIVNFGLTESNDEIISYVSIVNPLAAGIMSIIVSFRYSGTIIFQRSYLSLGIGYLAVAIGEVTYYIYDMIFNETSFPSVADGFFLAFYPLTTIHLLMNIRFFAPKRPKTATLSWLIVIPLIITFTFVVLYNNSEINLDFIISMMYVIPAGISLSLTIYSTSIFRQGLIGKTWTILLFGILSITFADLWYYYLEATESFDLQQPVNVFWYIGYWIVFYALYKHKQSI